MGVELENDTTEKTVRPIEEVHYYILFVYIYIYFSVWGFNFFVMWIILCLQEISEELDEKMKKYQRGGAADLKDLKDKKLKGQLAHREKLYDKSAKAAAKYEKVSDYFFFGT